MKTIDFSYFIERYHAGEMNDSEKEWFLKELEWNENLRNEVKLRKLTDEVLRKQDIISLRTKLSRIETERKVEVYSGKKLKHVYLQFAAVVAGLVLIGSITLFTGYKLNNDEIIKRYYKAYEIPSVQRSGHSGINADFSLALEFYNTHEYGKAAILFNKVLENNPRDMQSELLSGISSFGEKKYPEAKQSFAKVIDDDNSLFVEAAKWYLAFCYVKTNEKEKALKQFQIVINEGGIYSKDAKKIIRRFK